MAPNQNTDVTATLNAGGKTYTYFSLDKAQSGGLRGIDRLPYCLRALLENNLRHKDGQEVTTETLGAFSTWATHGTNPTPISYYPTRVMMPDSSGLPAVTDMAAMRDRMVDLGKDPALINPARPFDLVMDHSITAEFTGAPDSLLRNMQNEFACNRERYEVAKWAQGAFENLRVLPPGQGICHQINLEHLARVVWSEPDLDGNLLAFPDSLVGGDSHTPMVNALSVLGWGVGGIEAISAILGQPISMVLPDVVAMRLSGTLREGVSTTDLVLAITKRLREHGVVGKFVEYFGPALAGMTIPDRATISNMCPEYGASLGFFPVDDQTLKFFELTGRGDQIPLIEAYAKAQGLWRDDTVQRTYTETIDFDLGRVETSVAGPNRPQQLVALGKAHLSAKDAVATLKADTSPTPADAPVKDGDIVIAAITSCTNTSNPGVMIAAGLLAQKARAKDLTAKPWIKTSMSPGSRVVTDYLTGACLMTPLEELGFFVAGFGCMTCGGGSGPLAADIEAAITDHNIPAAAVVSSNRNFEGRIHPHLKLAYIAQPALVVAYAIAGTMLSDIRTEPLGSDADGEPVYLKDLWPTSAEVDAVLRAQLKPELFTARYADTGKGTDLWNEISAPTGLTYEWTPGSTYMRQPPFLRHAKAKRPPREIANAAILAIYGDSVTTDHIAPGGQIMADTLAGQYLASVGVAPGDLSGFTQRRVNHDVMLRGAFNNPRIQNEMVPEKVGGWTRHSPSGATEWIFDTAARYRQENRPMVIFAGREYGTGSSRDWAAKNPFLLGVEAIIAESFERIHRANLAGMGVLPLQFKDGETRQTLGLDGSETIQISSLSDDLRPGMALKLHISRSNGRQTETQIICRLETNREIDWYKAGGVMPYVLESFGTA